MRTQSEMAGFSRILEASNFNKTNIALPVFNSKNVVSQCFVTRSLCQVAKFCHFAMTFSVYLTSGLTDFVNLVDANASLASQVKEFFPRLS
jgi:hypothetical protein